MAHTYTVGMLVTDLIDNGPGTVVEADSESGTMQVLWSAHQDGPEFQSTHLMSDKFIEPSKCEFCGLDGSDHVGIVDCEPPSHVLGYEPLSMLRHVPSCECGFCHK